MGKQISEKRRIRFTAMIIIMVVGAVVFFVVPFLTGHQELQTASQWNTLDTNAKWNRISVEETAEVKSMWEKFKAQK